MTLRQQCAGCGLPFDYQHGDGTEKGGPLMFMVIQGGWDLYKKDGTHIYNRWTVDLCSKRCLKRWYKEKYGEDL